MLMIRRLMRSSQSASQAATGFRDGIITLMPYHVVKSNPLDGAPLFAVFEQVVQPPRCKIFLYGTMMETYPPVSGLVE